MRPISAISTCGDGFPASPTTSPRQTSSSLKEFDNATTHLREAVNELKQEISHFKVAG